MARDIEAFLDNIRNRKLTEKEFVTKMCEAIALYESEDGNIEGLVSDLYSLSDKMLDTVHGEK